MIIKPSLTTVLVVILAAIGVFFRFYNLEKKVYWNDEVWTSLILSGHTGSEMLDDVFDGHELAFRDVQKYQHINSDRSWTSTISSLAAQDPKHSPLYYALLRLWAGSFGDSIRAVRSFSAFIGLLVLPSIYWLCRELFEAPRTAWMAFVLMAVSPFHVLYAQEAREYSLWTVTILLSSVALLRALRYKTYWAWSVYAATVAVGFYSHTLFGLVTIAHAFYVAVLSLRNAKSKIEVHQLLAYSFATFAALTAFAPWGVIIARNIFRLLATTTRFAAAKVGVFQLIGRWTVGVSSLFLDVSYDFSNPWKQLFRVPILIPVAYAIYFLCFRSSERVWAFALTLILTPVVLMMMPDLILGGRSISLPRFLIPFYLGLQIAVAYLLATKTISGNPTGRKIWQAVTFALILCGMVSCGISSQAQAWWNKSFISMPHPQAARLINESPRPLLISDSSGSNFPNVISLAYLLDPKVRLRLVVDEKDLHVPDTFSDVFLFRPSASTRRKLEIEDGYRIEIVDIASGLWRLAR